MISRWDSAAIVPNTSELLPEPETPVNTVSRRFAISTLTSLRLFTRAPCTRIRSWLSASADARAFVAVVLALLIVSPSVGRAAVGVAEALGYRYRVHMGEAVRAGRCRRSRADGSTDALPGDDGQA